MVLHEVSHGWVAWQLGDPTAKRAGRLTLNPVPHVDPIGTILVPLSLVLFQVMFNTSFFIFGWAKPVPINPNYFREPEKGMLWVGLAGPLTNIILFSIASALGRLMLPLYINSFLGRTGGFLFEFAKNSLWALVFFLGVSMDVDESSIWIKVQ